MTYRRFEALALAVGAVAIGVTILMSLRPAPDYLEIAAQLLLFGVLAAAVHRGLAGGAAAALGATLAYILLRIPVIVDGGMTTEILQLIVARTIAYGVVGIVGGELCARVKYILARMRDDRSIDEESRVYSQRLVAHLIEGNVSAHTRYGTDFSLVLVQVTPSTTAERSPRRAANLIRSIADHLRNDIRMVDEVGRLDDGRFVLVLPQTPRQGAEVAAERIATGVRGLLGARDDAVTTTVMSADQDLAAILTLAGQIAVPTSAPDASEPDARMASRRDQQGSGS